MFQFRRKKYRQYSDEELVLKFKINKDSICIGILYERYSHLVMGVALKYLKNEADAQDLTSKIFEELSNKITKHSIEFFKSWLYRVTMNEAFQILRKTNRISSIEDVSVFEKIQEEEDIVLKDQKIDLLEDAISNLKNDQKKCIQLFYLEEKSYQQISDELQISINQVKSYIQNGKRNIKIQLEELNEFKNEK